MKARPADKETLHAAIHAAVEGNGGKRISYRDFITASGLKHRDIFHNYPRWEDAMRGAGFTFKHYQARPASDVLLAEWGSVVRKLRRVPTMPEFRLHGPRASKTVGLRFGSWLGVPGAFRRFARKRKEWADVIGFINSDLKKTRRPVRPRFTRKSCAFKPGARRARRMRDRPEFGDLLDIAALRHTPSNELGVVYLFGIVAESLGFAVEHMQSAFPDCLAKRRLDGSRRWQNVTIEFEYESRNFRNHGHDPSGCDIIICWEHNWPDCPKNLEVIALSEEIMRLGSGVAHSDCAQGYAGTRVIALSEGIKRLDSLN